MMVIGIKLVFLWMFHVPRNITWELGIMITWCSDYCISYNMRHVQNMLDTEIHKFLTWRKIEDDFNYIYIHCLYIVYIHTYVFPNIYYIRRSQISKNKNKTSILVFHSPGSFINGLIRRNFHTGSVFNSIFHLVGRTWFELQPALAISILVSAFSFSGICFQPLVAYFTHHHGWRQRGLDPWEFSHCGVDVLKGSPSGRFGHKLTSRKVSCQPVECCFFLFHINKVQSACELIHRYKGLTAKNSPGASC